METETMEQTVDAVQTEAKEGREQKGKREKGSIDWGAIKKRWNNGESVGEISQATGVKEATIYSHAMRYRWPKRQMLGGGRKATIEAPALVEKAVEKAVETGVATQMPALNAAIREKLAVWFEKVLKTTDRLQSQIDGYADGRLEVEEIKTLSSSLETVDRIARRTFGLDSPSGSSSVSVFSVASPSIGCPIIDVEAIPEATPSAPA
jgi:transposase